MSSPAISLCLECNAELGPADVGGLCPKCLLKLGLASQLSAGTLPARAVGIGEDGTIEEPFEFGAYRILRLLGKGGMGAVYEAEHRESGRRVALKVLGQSLDTPEMRQRFLREGQLAASVRHPNVVTVLSAEEVESTPVIAMELLHDGTLKDWVKRRGPLPVREAVDAVLQIIEGLEAARAAGVLHRDVKPANCFAGNDGVVKVGDFGLSISTLVQAEQSLTKSGAVLGTPAFAAPEQLRGEEIDARADIYAVGATLYFLLTGKPAFEAESLVGLIAAVLEKSPIAMRRHRRDLPGGLCRIVERCMEKDRGKRFSSYSTLYRALAPYGSEAVAPATLGLRFAAGVLDAFAMAVPILIGFSAWSDVPETHWVSEWSIQNFLWFLVTALWMIGWYAVPEAIWGRSLGKALCGLRVVRLGGGPIGWGTSFARASVFSASEIVMPLLCGLMMTQQEYLSAVSEGRTLVTEWMEFGYLALLFVTMRRANGYAALHDLISRSRVVLESRVTIQAPGAQESVRIEEVAAGEKVGPYWIVRRDGNLAQGIDPVLRRRVWVVFREKGQAHLSPQRMPITRSSRLRWLQGCRGPEENWDAFEMPDGKPLETFEGTKQEWLRVRGWLMDLANEFHAAAKDGTLAEPISPAHVWITNSGHAVMLDFPAPGTRQQASHFVASEGAVQEFLHRVAKMAMSPVMPLHAQEFMESLEAKRFEALSIVAGNLQALMGRSAQVNTVRRALSALLFPMMILAGILTVAALMFSARKKFDAAWREAHPELPSPRLALEILDTHHDGAKDLRAAVAARVARIYGKTVVGDAFWNSEAVHGLSEMGDIGRFPAEMQIATELGNLERAQSGGANGKEAGNFPGEQEVDEFVSRQGVRGSLWFFVITAGVLLMLGGYALATVQVATFGFPLALRVFGFVVVDANGRSAGRGRLLVRTFMAALPLLGAGAWLVAREAWFWDLDMHYPWLGTGLLAGLVLTWLCGFAPQRSIPDRVAGTWVVPR